MKKCFSLNVGALSDPRLVARPCPLMLGLPVQSDDPTPEHIYHRMLRDKRMLLILDNCRTRDRAVASLMAIVFVAAPHVHFLATSREALRF